MTSSVTMYTCEGYFIAHYELATRTLCVPKEAPSWLILETIYKGATQGDLELYEHEEGASLAKRCKLSAEMLPNLKAILDNFPAIKETALKS